MSDITVYTTEPCSFCARVKGLLKARGLEFAEVNLSKDPAGRMELAKRTGMMSFPQVIVEDSTNFACGLPTPRPIPIYVA